MARWMEARQLLSELLAQLQNPDSRHYARYGKWIEKHGASKLEDQIVSFLRPEVSTYLQLGNGSVNSLKNIGGNLMFEGRAVYLHGILGQDRRSRIYIGQSTSLNARLKQHWNFRYRRDNFSLHYHAVQNSVYDVFAVLAMLPHPSAPGVSALPGMDQPDLILNILEMWCCLLFRTLPPQVLSEYGIPPKPALGEGSLDVGLNIANPLDHGGRGGWETVDLSTSDDPLVLDYLKEVERKAYPDYVPGRKPAVSPAAASEEKEAKVIEEPAVKEESQPKSVDTPSPIPCIVSSISTMPPSTWFFVGTTMVLGLCLFRKSFVRLSR